MASSPHPYDSTHHPVIIDGGLSQPRIIFLAFSRSNSASIWRHSDNAVSLMPTTSLSRSSWSARSPCLNVETSFVWPDRYFFWNGAYRLEIISAYSKKGSGPKLKPYSHWTPKVLGVLIDSVTISASYSLLSKLYWWRYVRCLWMQVNYRSTIKCHKGVLSGNKCTQSFQLFGPQWS